MRKGIDLMGKCTAFSDRFELEQLCSLKSEYGMLSLQSLRGHISLVWVRNEIMNLDLNDAYPFSRQRMQFLKDFRASFRHDSQK